jgi:hypothetical protein
LLGKKHAQYDWWKRGIGHWLGPRRCPNWLKVLMPQTLCMASLPKISISCRAKEVFDLGRSKKIYVVRLWCGVLSALWLGHQGGTAAPIWLLFDSYSPPIRFTKDGKMQELNDRCASAWEAQNTSLEERLKYTDGFRQGHWLFKMRIYQSSFVRCWIRKPGAVECRKQ